MLKGENFCGFCRLSLAVNALPLKFFLLCNFNTKLGGRGQIAEVFPT